MTTIYDDTIAVLTSMPGSTVIESTDIGCYAVELAMAGWRAFPLTGKTPAIGNPHPWGSPERQRCKRECGLDGHGVLDATDDLGRVTAWWSGRYAGANIGARVPDNVFVLDVDPRNGGADSLARLVTEYGEVFETRTAASGRGDGGRHFYYRAPDARLTSRLLGAGLDVKTSAGYCVVPPSIHPDTGKPYVWTVEGPIMAPPPWLLDLVVVPPPPVYVKPRRTTGRDDVFGAAYVGTSVADAYGERVSWAEILEPHGWRCLDPDGDADGARWLHPAATSSCSATVRFGCLFVYSENTPFDRTEAGDPRGVTKFRAFAVLDRNGDMSAAARDLVGR